MATATADQGLHLRLSYLRSKRGGQAFLTEDPTTGQDPTGSVSLEVDASGWVTSSRVSDLEGLREVDDFVAAVRHAYVAAATARMAANGQARHQDRPPSLEEQERGRAIAEGRLRLEPPPRPHFPRWELPTGPVDDRVLAPGLDAGERPVTGRSRGDEIQVTATVAAGLGAVQVDANWLRGTSIDLAHYALREAFEDLQEKGAH